MYGEACRTGGVTRRAFILAAAAGLTALLVGCGGQDSDPAAQPAPGVTTFVPGVFDDLPQFPRAEPLGPRTEKDGVVARSYKAPGASPEQILNFYRDALKERWRMLTPVERLGVGTLRADWVSDSHRLRVSATTESGLDSRNDASVTFVSQYNLTLHPL